MLKKWMLTLRTISITLLAGSVAAVNGCDGWATSDVKMDQPILRVAALREPLTRVRPGQGVEHDLIWQFAGHLGSRVQWTWMTSPEQVIDALTEGRADIGAGRWSVETIESQNLRRLGGPAYEESRAALVCKRDLRSRQDEFFLQSWFRKDKAAPVLIEDRPLKIGVHRRDALARLLSELQSQQLEWTLFVGNESVLARASQVQRQKIDCFVTDLNTAHFVTSIRPFLRVAQQMNFRFSRTLLFSAHEPQIERAFSQWFSRYNRSGQISRIRHRYLGYQKSIDNMDRARLIRARSAELPELKSKFKKYGAEFDLPWELVAAVAYQESHWNPRAQSPTGVRGIMQLTRETARHLGVEDREDLEQSLWGGAKYLRYLIDRQPSHLHFREKLALALAAYNVGLAHLKDAQKLAVEAGRSPFSFWDLRLMLPLLSDPAVAADLEYGLARGEEPVQFTERVLAFYDILADRAEVY
jgi:membrane-bound lytic murein transglycosylase F